MFSKKRGLNRRWLTDITEHWTDEGKLYLGAFEKRELARRGVYEHHLAACRLEGIPLPVHVLISC